jgi:hypothetical protein
MSYNPAQVFVKGQGELHLHRGATEAEMARMGRRTPLVVASFMGGFLGMVLIAALWVGGQRAVMILTEPISRIQVCCPRCFSSGTHKRTARGCRLGLSARRG